MSSICEAIPLAGHQVSFRVDAVERLRWHHGPQYPRPFLFPVRGPSGAELTRMGHPGAANHDHHRSVWFAHHAVTGVDFWSDTTPAFIRQKRWLAYADGSEAVMAVLLAWHDGHDPRELLEQELVVSVRPHPQHPSETLIELQSTFVPVAEMLEFGKTNYGFLAARVAKTISEHFGGGHLTNDEGQQGEPRLFGQPSRWMDYSGEVTTAAGPRPEGITYFDHPANPDHPARWHVREDGWMGASVCMEKPRTTSKQQPLTLRYLLHAHAGGTDLSRSQRLFAKFSQAPPWEVAAAGQLKHQQFVVRRRA